MYQRYSPRRRLIKADSLETFLAHRFPSAKRFGLEGAEATIPGIQAVVDAAAAVGRDTPVDLSGRVTTTYTRAACPYARSHNGGIFLRKQLC